MRLRALTYSRTITRKVGNDLNTGFHRHVKVISGFNVRRDTQVTFPRFLHQQRDKLRF